jgi:hypothetical protein
VHLVASLRLVVAAACAYPNNLHRSSTAAADTTLSHDGVVLRLARARCRRAAECNNVEHMYGTKTDCMDREADAAQRIATTCQNGFDGPRLGKCLDALHNQFCDADMGPATDMPDCTSYCARPNGGELAKGGS